MRGTFRFNFARRFTRRKVQWKWNGEDELTNLSETYDWWIQPRCFGRSKDERTAEAGCLRDVSEHQWIAQSCKMVCGLEKSASRSSPGGIMPGDEGV
ncbi:MAG: hypothetical protein ACTS45_00660 [Candidatus Hodgkinia cicadicola]